MGRPVAIWQRLPERGLGRLMPGIEQLGHGPLGDARIVDLRISRDPRVVDVLPRQANVGGGGWLIVPFRNDTWLSDLRDLAPFLRGVVLVGEAALGRRLDLKRGLGGLWKDRALRWRDLIRAIG